VTALRERGFIPYILPLSRIEALPFSLPDTPFTALLATSANAFIYAGSLPEKLKTLPLYCVGGKTAAAAKARGFSECVCIAANSDALIARLKSAPRGYWLYLTGRPRRAAIENYFRAANIACHTAEVYETQSLIPAAADLSNLPNPVAYILLYSAQNAANLPCLSEHISTETRLLCLSPRIAAAVPPQWRNQARITAEPTERDLFQLLPKI